MRNKSYLCIISFESIELEQDNLLYSIMCNFTFDIYRQLNDAEIIFQLTYYHIIMKNNIKEYFSLIIFLNKVYSRFYVVFIHEK